MTLAPLPGNPAALNVDVTNLERASLVLAEATELLEGVGVDGRGLAMNALRESSTGLAGGVRRAHGRYDGTASALRTYVVVLTSAHETGQTAINREADGIHQMRAADGRLDDARHERLTLEMGGGSAAAIEAAIHAEHAATLAIDRAGHLIGEARALYGRATSQIEDAAQLAMSLINASFGETNDSNWDEFKNFFAPLGDFFQKIAEWIGSILKAALDLLVAVVAIVVLALAVVILALAVIIVLAVVLYVAIALITYLLKVVAIALVIFAVTELLGVDDRTQLRILATFLGIAIPPLGLYIVDSILRDVTAPTPAVREVHSVSDLDPANQDQADAYLALDVREPAETVAELVQEQGLIDDAGQADQSVVSIERVVDAEGVERWVITLPSTMEWNLLTDRGATNDGGSNLPLLLTPELATQYERAVLEAMSQAGITPDDPIMFVGFSQGGILAALMAEKHHDEYNIDALLVVGAPIESAIIPPDVQVLSVELNFDAVHQADMHVGGNPPNITTVTGGPEWVNPIDQHSNENYVNLLEDRDSAGRTYTEMFSDFLVDDGGTFERHFYAFSE